MDYRDRMRALREDNDLTQEVVGKILGVNQQTYSKYERGDLKLPIEDLILLAKYYNVSMEYICGLTNSKGTYPKM